MLAGQAKPDKPRWKRKKQPPGPVITVKGRGARRLTRDLRTAAAVQAATVAPKPVSTPAPLVRAGAFRFRRHLVPFEWLALMLATGLGAHAAHAAVQGALIGLGEAALIMLGAQHLTVFARGMAALAAGLTMVWVPVLAAVGWHRPWPVLLLGCWAAVTVPWVRRYQWRPAVRQPQPDMTDVAVFQRLAAKRRWSGQLTTREEIPDGHRWRIALDGAETHIGEVLAHPRAVAAAWGKPVTEAYVEPSPDGIESTGYLTILRRSGLREVRDWDGGSIDPLTGFAVIGRFPDRQPMRVQYFAPRDGVYHAIYAGATGSGKSTALDLDLAVAVTSGLVIPIVLDPQQGQSLPAWQDHLITAEGVDECMRRLRGIHAGMLARSAYLAKLRWNDRGKSRRGMGFFDRELTGLPVIEVVLDEAPALLTQISRADARRAEEATKLVSDLAVRGRKAGVRVVLAAAVPSLDNLGGDRALRSMLAACNSVCLRTAQSAEAGMIGIAADPSQLPRFFPDGSKTQGLAYANGPDNRPSTPGRTDRVPDAYEVAENAVLPEMDAVFGDAMAAAMAGNKPAAIADVPAVVPSGDTGVVWAILEQAGRPLDRGEVLHGAKGAGMNGGGLFQNVSLALEELLAGLPDGRRAERTEEGAYRCLSGKR